jgi:pimeloyl-ACP methyl ester carboxylesterase
VTDVIFLPGIIAPAALRYGPLLGHLPEIRAILKDLEVYAADRPPADYSVQSEIDGIEATADRAGIERFHIYAHSGGAACALAFVAAQPDRVLSLAIDEPATDFTAADHADPYWQEIDAAAALPAGESVPAFLRLQVADGVPLPAPPPGPPPASMAKRSLGMQTFATALRHHQVVPDAYRSFARPVLFTSGSLTHPRWATMRDRLHGLFPDFTSEEFEGLHHLNTSHQAAPAQTAALVLDVWAKAEAQAN